jgi:cobalt/nickel transport system ATP-binding protein
MANTKQPVSTGGESEYPPAVLIDNLRFSYDHEPVLRDVRLTIEQGERFGLIGPSGAGKSTLLLHLNGILRGEGKIMIAGIELRKDTLPVIRKKVGLVFQNPDDQLFHPTVREDVAFGPLNFGLDRDKIEERIERTLELLNLKGFADKTSHHLSYGEKKRVALATVLSMDPEIVAFDEPFANLDPTNIKKLIATIRSLDATVILVSQQILPALLTCDRLAVIKEGRIIASGPTAVIAANRPLLEECGLDFRFYVEELRKRGIAF